MSYLLSFLSIIINDYVLMICYRKLSDNCKVNKIKEISLTLVLSIIIYIINYYVQMNLKMFAILLSMFLIFKILFKDKVSLTLLKTLVIYIILFACDFCISIFIMLSPFYDKAITLDINILKAITTSLFSVLIYGLYSIKKFVAVLNKFIMYIDLKKKTIVITLAVIIFLGFYFIVYFNAFKGTLNSYLISMLMSIFFIGFFIVIILLFYKKKQIEYEQNKLLELMSDYEDLLDRDKENRHEMLNNLIVLKSEKNKSSKKFEDMLDDVIEHYQTARAHNYSSLYRLPSGIKGIVYYKMSNIKQNDLIFTSVIDNKVYKIFDNLDSKQYFKVCKILGILMDNAIEAATYTKEKQILIDIYLESNDIIIYIENTFKGKVNIDEINKKGFSTKGKDRGIGLHVVSNLLKGNENISMEQSIENHRFVSKLKIKL